MSVFRVKLQNTAQGTLDVDMLTGQPNATSRQRTIVVTGPNHIQRRLVDGEQFTDSNYWKQFAYPQVALNEAFIEVVTDDGSVYSEVENENVFPVVWTPGTAGVIGAGDGPSDTNMSLDIVETYGAPAMFVQIKCTDSSDGVKVKLNGNADAVFTLESNSTQIFNHGDLVITKIEFDNSASGTNEVNAVEVILSIKSKSNS
jgi:hypothetical protein